MELNTLDVMKLLPHRYPFLLVDKITEFIKDEQIVGVKNVTINEPFFQGHFPDHPVMPGVLILEAMAQVGGVYAIVANEVGENQVPYFVGIDKAKFRKPVQPGDVLVLSLVLQKVRRGIYYFLGKATVDGKLVAEAELKATFADK
ncbi:MAG: 3-hydroxyacyl-ACP dehydratase FabZ [Deltaproteobacteria bacterium]|jgi:3-hydroxyacyl-[acyl-carrier-protein] dehydratase|nr:3-hydroxyacyl-ACP dehydratase FabZ [Deltaproteobacteria bacterium]